MKFHATGKSLGPAAFRLSIIPLVDVVLFLLIYFLYAGALDQTEAELAAALASERPGAALTHDLAPQIVLVTRGPAGEPVYQVGEHVLPDKQSLIPLLRRLPKDGGVFVRVRGGVPVGAVAAALQACADAGFRRVTYVPSD